VGRHSHARFPIEQFKMPEIALVGDGAEADVIAPDFSLVKKTEVDGAVNAFPRLQFKNAFVKTCADVVRKYPRGAGNSLMRICANATYRNSTSPISAIESLPPPIRNSVCGESVAPQP
jgi:hypothetical protein